MRIALYGLPTAGKTFILDRLDFIDVIAGSKMLREVYPNFDSADDAGKDMARKGLAELLATRDNFIMDGHYAFGDKLAFTESDGRLYDCFLYLFISPDVLKQRMRVSERNKAYLCFDIEAWQNREIDGIREYCHSRNKDFYLIDNPTNNVFTDISVVVEFINDIVNGYSCAKFAESCALSILNLCKSDTITLMDGDKTITKEDSSHAVFGYTTHLYDGNFYTGYQSWRQGREFETYDVEALYQMPVSLNEAVVSHISDDTFILTSGHERVWSYIAGQLGVPYFCGNEMSAETKLYITKHLQKAGKRVIAYGDGMNDYYMLKQADEGFLVTKSDSSISRSLRNRDLEGINLV